MTPANKRTFAAVPAAQPPAWKMPGSQPQSISLPEVTFPVGVLAFYLLMRFSMLPDFMAARFGVNSRYQYVCVPILVIASLFGGRLGAVIGSSLGVWLITFSLWMGACIPTSFWQGGSFAVFKDYIPNELMVSVAVACLACTIPRLKRVLYAVSGAMMFFVLITAFTSGTTVNDRAQMNYGTYGNPNSIASHLLFLGPFLFFYFMLERKRVGVRAPAALFVLAGAAVFFFRSGSRGGLLAFLAVLAIVFVRLSPSKKLVAVVLFLLAVPVSIAVLPRAALLRYSTLFTDSSDPGEIGVGSAMQSTAERKELFWESVAVSFRNPIFGVGPGQFSDYSADQAHAAGQRARWLVTHNSYTQVSSEMGLVGFVFYMGALVTIGVKLGHIRKSTRGDPRLETAYLIASCLFVSWVAYCVFSMFDYIAYKQYVPLMAGLTVGLDAAVKSELESGTILEKS